MADSDTGHRKAWATGARSSSTVNKPELFTVRLVLMSESVTFRVVKFFFLTCSVARK